MIFFYVCVNREIIFIFNPIVCKNKSFLFSQRIFLHFLNEVGSFEGNESLSGIWKLFSTTLVSSVSVVVGYFYLDPSLVFYNEFNYFIRAFILRGLSRVLDNFYSVGTYIYNKCFLSIFYFLYEKQWELDFFVINILNTYPTNFIFYK